MALKYAVYPDMVRSVIDGQEHFIPSRILMHLYGVKEEECLVISRSAPEREYEERTARAKKLGLIPLRPKHSGNYTLPAADCG